MLRPSFDHKPRFQRFHCAQLLSGAWNLLKSFCQATRMFECSQGFRRRGRGRVRCDKGPAQPHLWSFARYGHFNDICLGSNYWCQWYTDMTVFGKNYIRHQKSEGKSVHSFPQPSTSQIMWPCVEILAGLRRVRPLVWIATKCPSVTGNDCQASPRHGRTDANGISFLLRAMCQIGHAPSHVDRA